MFDPNDASYIDPVTGEVVSRTVSALQLALSSAEAERDVLNTVVHLAQERNDELTRQLADARRQLIALRDRLGTTDVPAGAMHLVGRVVKLEGRTVAVVVEGRPVWMSIPTGWDFPIQNGLPVAVEARFDPAVGFKVWRMNHVEGEAAAGLAELDPGLIDRLTSPKPKADPAAKLTNIEDIDKDVAAAGDLRRHAHHVSRISLHIVLVRHRRGVDFPLTDDMASALKLDVADVVTKSLGWKLLAVNTGSIDARHRHDHLHLAAGQVDATKPIGQEIGRLKAITSKRMRAKFPELAALESFWSAGYFVSGFGGPTEPAVRAYIANQEQ